ncbi:acyl transferase/acyl hydrolase/lysophospholipase [Ilyonectria sp. MPI-CAGE-AT-0026]|nr:acyl transferase/acyl hydrolase/lysophospholipase [Ilyonectria sp. MPI-CAGE-AT-0026]
MPKVVGTDVSLCEMETALALRYVDENAAEAPRETFRTQKTGLHPIYEPDLGPDGSCGKEPRVMIFGGHKEKIPNATVLSFAYRTLPKEAAVELLGDLIDYMTAQSNCVEWEDVPIILVSHSTGGLVAKEAFLSSHPDNTKRPRYTKLHKLIKSFVFIATDHYTGISDFATMYSGIPTSMRKTLQTLRPISEGSLDWLEGLMPLKEQALYINHNFASQEGEKLTRACFYETEATPISMLIPMSVSTWSKMRVGNKVEGIVIAKERATLELPWIENRPLAGNHFTITRFDDAKSSAKVVHLLRDIFDGFSSTPASSLQLPVIAPAAGAVATSTTTFGLRILSLDGGGVKGLFAVIILEAIMEEVRKIDCKDDKDALKPCDYFHFIGGTSTGGLLALMLGRLRMDLASCRQAYRTMSLRIFSEWRIPGKIYWDMLWGTPLFSGDKLQLAIQDIVSQRISIQEKVDLEKRHITPEEAPMEDPWPESGLEPRGRTLLCAVIDKGNTRGSKCERLRTYDCNDLQKARATPCTIWEACRATSAAPVYFPSIRIKGRTYWDGGLSKNNPIREVYDEAISEYDGHPFEAIVSIGTGMPFQGDPSTSGMGLLNYAIQKMTDTELEHKEFSKLVSKDEQLRDRYFRFNDETRLCQVDLAAYEKLDEVESCARDFVASPVGGKLVMDCAAKLARRR